MKRISLLHFLILFNLIIFSSCKKDCPEPEVNNVTTYVATLRDGQVQDTYVTSHYPTNNSSTDVGIEVVAWTEGNAPFVRRSYIKFDYSSIPAGATIKKATLTLHADTERWTEGHSTLTGSNAWYFRKVTSTWNANTVTWNSRPTDNASGQLSLSASTSADQTYTIDLTSMVKDEIAAPASANGFVMQLANEEHYRALSFASSENSNTALRPTLVIEYSK